MHDAHDDDAPKSPRKFEANMQVPVVMLLVLVLVLVVVPGAEGTLVP